MTTGVSRTRSGPTGRSAPHSVNDPCRTSRSEAPPTATRISPGSTMRAPSRAQNAVRSACSRKVIWRAWPGGSGSTELPGWRSASRERRYEDGWPAGSLGSSTGSRPLGTTRPDSTPAIVRPPSSPGKNACTAAASCPASGPIA
jgi:hypothetical protein